ncbi:MAG: aldehyde dehydrogenase [Alphaproteobacteria bacterium]|nr:aldehyde dehydrogenase [Alphaproteobacteria bacterium]
MNQIVRHTDIDIRNAQQVAELRAKLLEFSESDTAAFAEQTREFMLACNVPASEPGTKDATTVRSFINGVAMYSLPDTTYSEYDVIHGKAKRGAELWNAMPLMGRQAFFRIMAEEIGPQYKAAIDLAITLEVGKAGSEFAKTIQWDKWAASPEVERYLSGTFVVDDLGRKYYLNQIAYMPEDAKNIYFYQGQRSTGLGICGSTNGFNYPAALAVPDIAASRVCGNGFIGKVPSKSPSFLYIRKKAENEALDLMAERFESYKWANTARHYGVDLSDEIIVRRLKNSFGIISGRNVIEQWAHACTAFRIVGGKSAGKIFREYRMEVDRSLEHTILELAGNNPAVIMPSAANLKGGLEKVVADLAEGNKSNSGQRCTSPRRWMVHKDIYETVKELAVASYTATANNENGAIDNPLDEKTDIGAIDKGGFKDAQEYLQKARDLGARVIGGNRVYTERFPNAYYMSPALVIWENVSEDKKQLMHQDEIFAPIANLDIIDDLNDAIAKTNRSTEHLSSGFYCDNDHIHELCTYMQGTNLGSLIHNGPPKDLSPEGIHAGRDDGGIGITGGLESLDQYMRARRDNNIRLLAKVSSIDAAKKLAEQLLASR